MLRTKEWLIQFLGKFLRSFLWFKTSLSENTCKSTLSQKYTFGVFYWGQKKAFQEGMETIEKGYQQLNFVIVRWQTEAAALRFKAKQVCVRCSSVFPRDKWKQIWPEDSDHLQLFFTEFKISKYFIVIPKDQILYQQGQPKQSRSW